MDWKQSRFLRITVGAVVFGVLMGFSQTLASIRYGHGFWGASQKTENNAR